MKRRRMVRVAILTAALAALGLSVFIGTQPPTVGLGVTLIANMEQHLVITQGTPIQIEISLTSSPREQSVGLGSWWRAWHEYVGVEDVITDQTLPWTFEFVDATSFALEPGTESDGVVTTTGRVARLDHGRQVHTATYVVPPVTTLAGVYHLRAVVQVPPWHVWGWRGRAVSAPVTITVRDRDDGEPGLAALEERRLRYAAKYYLSTGLLTDAQSAAEELQTHRADDPATHILLGDIFAAAQRDVEALAAYRRAMILLPPSPEEPVLLLRRINRILYNESQ